MIWVQLFTFQYGPTTVQEAIGLENVEERLDATNKRHFEGLNIVYPLWSVREAWVNVIVSILHLLQNKVSGKEVIEIVDK